MRKGRQVVQYKGEHVLPHYVGMDGVLRSKGSTRRLRDRCKECDCYIGAGRISGRPLCRQCYFDVNSEAMKEWYKAHPKHARTPKARQ
jgi:hypothetical protein